MWTDPRTLFSEDGHLEARDVVEVQKDVGNFFVPTFIWSMDRSLTFVDNACI